MKTVKYLLLIPIYAVSSWIIVHLFAFFGFFIALAYPIWWALFPKATICFSCKSRGDGKKCHFCNKKIDTKDPSYPHVSNLPSSIKNGLLIGLFSLFSIVFVYGEAKLLNRLGIPGTPKTVSFVIPSKGQYKLGEIFPMKIEIVGIETPINAVQADITFDPYIIEVVDISTEDSFASVFIQKEIQNEAGYARLTGGLPNPGFFSDKGVFGTVFFRGKSPGVVKIEFSPTSMVLANDGHGTNVLKELASVSYLILPERIDKNQEEMQKELISVKTFEQYQSNKTQMKFFDDSNILGESTKSENNTPEIKTDSDILKKIGELIEKYDSYVVSLWNKILGRE